MALAVNALLCISLDFLFVARLTTLFDGKARTRLLCSLLSY